jgi:hypothetical protein
VSDQPLSAQSAMAELCAAVADYDAKLAEYNATGYDGLRMGFGAVRARVIAAARAIADSHALDQIQPDTEDR